MATEKSMGSPLTVLSVGHANKLAEAATQKSDFALLSRIAETVLSDNDLTGSSDNWHNLSAEYARSSDYTTAYRLVVKGLSHHQFSVDLLADAVHYGGNSAIDATKIETYIETLKKLPLGRWNWRAFTFLIDYYKDTLVNQQCESAEIEKTLKSALTLAINYTKAFPKEDKAFLAEAEVRLELTSFYRGNADTDNADKEYSAALSILRDAVNDQRIKAVQCGIKLADLLFEDKGYKEVVEVCNRSLQDPEEQASASLPYLTYIKALSEEAIVYMDNNTSNKEITSRVLTQFEVAYTLLKNRPTYRSNILNRATIFAKNCSIPIPEWMGDSQRAESELLSLLSNIGQ